MPERSVRPTGRGGGQSEACAGRRRGCAQHPRRLCAAPWSRDAAPGHVARLSRPLSHRGRGGRRHAGSPAPGYVATAPRRDAQATGGRGRQRRQPHPRGKQRVASTLSGHAASCSSPRPQGGARGTRCRMAPRRWRRETRRPSLARGREARRCRMPHSGLRRSCGAEIGWPAVATRLERHRRPRVRRGHDALIRRQPKIHHEAAEGARHGGVAGARVGDARDQHSDPRVVDVGRLWWPRAKAAPRGMRKG